MKNTKTIRGFEFNQILTIKKATSLEGKKIRFTCPVDEANNQYIAECVIGRVRLAHQEWGNSDPLFHKEQAEKNPYQYFEKLILNDNKGNRIGFTYSDVGKFFGADEGRLITYEVIS